MTTICLDPGHNSYGADTGAQGNGLREQDLTLDIAKRLKPLLEYNGFSVVMTREGDLVSDNSSVVASLQSRINVAENAHANLFISIHINAGGGTGQEVLIYGAGGQAKKCADIVLPYLVQAGQWYNRGVKVQNIMVLRETTMPAILTENGFIDTTQDAQKLADSDFRQQLAIAHCKGICAYFDIIYKEQSQPTPSPVPAPVPTPIEEKYVVPVGNNITPLNGGYGWIESLVDQKRVIIHSDKYTYISIEPSGIYVYTKGKDAIKLI